MQQRIRHLYPHHGALPESDTIPRGWITADGRFLKTKEHWVSISCQFRKPELRTKSKEEAEEDASEGERTAHLAYGLGWISVGHAGQLNAIGHERTFRKTNHPAMLTLRSLLSAVPELSIQIETQIGEYNPSRGVHEEFELRDYCLDTLIKRGRLKHQIQIA